MLTVRRAGAQTIVVDRGRFGYRHLGFAWCGAADGYAYDVANALVENDANAPSIEVTFGGAEFIFSQPVRFALAGADCAATLDGINLSNGCAAEAKAGSVLQLRRPDAGMRTILAVRGGFDIPSVLGSASTDLAAGIGGFDGRALRAGDAIAMARRPSVCRQALTQPHAWNGTLQVIAGVTFASLDLGAREALLSSEWIVGHESNRMGYRLHGPPMNAALDEMPSQAVFPGMIQLPRSGEPIVLLCDAQTTGGYPIIGSVVEGDLARLAQCRSGDRVRFVLVAQS